MSKDTDNPWLKEAEHWFARRLGPSIPDTEQAAFEHWRDQDPQRAAAYAETEKLWEELAILKHSERLRTLVPDQPTSRPSNLARARYRLLLALAASVAAIAVAAWLLHRPTPTQTYVTGLGEQRTETLADGTIIHLNTSSTLDVQLIKHQRRLTLRSGEAAFDVARDPTRPFVVTAGDGTITAVGTQFQVRHENNTVAITLLEGRVRVDRPAQREDEWLVPGQEAVFSEHSRGIIRRNVDVAVLTSWMRGRLEFRGTPLAQAVADVNRYSARKLRIGDPTIRDLAVSGSFRTGDADAVATAFEAEFALDAETGAQEIVLYGRERQKSGRDK